MTTWSAARENLRQAIVTAAGVDDGVVYWQDGPQYYGEVAVRLSIFGEQAIGPAPRNVTAYNATTHNTDQSEISEVLEFTLSVRVETLDNVTEPNALTIASRIRKGLSLQSVSDALSAAELVYYDDAPLRYTPFASDDHNVNAYTLDLFMRGQFELATPGVSYGTIEHVKISGTMAAGSDTVTINESVDKP